MGRVPALPRDGLTRKRRREAVARSGRGRNRSTNPEDDFEEVYGTSDLGLYALAAQRHMYEFGTTSAQLAEIKVAASHHAQFNPQAMLPKKVTVDDVLNSPMMSDPLHRLDSCVVTDSGGAIVVVSPEVARSLPRASVKILGQGEAPKLAMNGRGDLTYTGAFLTRITHTAPDGTIADIDLTWSGGYLVEISRWVVRP